MGLMKPLQDDLETLDLASRTVRRWVVVADEVGPLAHPIPLPADNRRGEVCWWVETGEALFP